jgi:hypothetical protein
MIRKEAEFSPGENKLNVELKKEKKFKIKVTTINYMNYTTLEYVKLKITYSKNDVVEEGLTSSNGCFIFETIKNDEFITILANKEGYSLAQRTFVKDIITYIKDADKSNKKDTIEKKWTTEPDEIEKELYIYLVKDNLLSKNNLLMITYSNLLWANFEPTILHSDRRKFITNIVHKYLDIKNIDKQKEQGILTTFITIKGINI